RRLCGQPGGGVLHEAGGRVRGDVWLVILGMATVTYLTRAPLLLALARRPLPPRLRLWLRLIPLAVLPALAVPMILVARDAGGAPPRPLARPSAALGRRRRVRARRRPREPARHRRRRGRRGGNPPGARLTCIPHDRSVQPGRTGAAGSVLHQPRRFGLRAGQS